MTDKTIKSGQEVIKEFLDHAGEDSGVDKGISTIRPCSHQKENLGAKLLKELERSARCGA
jgi:hypothetical protein